MRKTFKHLRKINVFEGSRGSKEAPKEGPGAQSRFQRRPRWPQVRSKLPSDELSWAKMGIRWAKMDKISDKMRQDGAKRRKMEDVSSVSGLWRSSGPRKPANKVGQDELSWAKMDKR